MFCGRLRNYLVNIFELRRGENMKKFILTAVVTLFSANAFASATSDTGFAKDLNSIAVTAAENIKTDKAEPIKPAKVEPQKTSAYVTVSGYVSLTGNAFMPQNGGFTSVNMTGWATFSDNTGRITSNNTFVNVMASMWIYPNQYVFQTVWPNIYVQLYRDGKYVGSTNMTGSVNVNGFPSSSFVYLNGSGYLNGSLYVEDAR